MHWSRVWLLINAYTALTSYAVCAEGDRGQESWPSFGRTYSEQFYSPLASGVPRISWTRPLTLLRSGLKVLWTHASKIPVTSRPIVERLDVVGNVGGCQISALVDSLLDAFLLQATEERLGNGVVPTITSSAHARFEPVGTAERRQSLLPY